jgi:hypothetical protein
MQDLLPGRIVKVISPFEFILRDSKDLTDLKIQMQPTPNKCFQHLLKGMQGSQITYELEKKKSHMIR